MNQRLKHTVRERPIALIFIGTVYRQKNLVEWAAGLSTASAQEMQKGWGRWRREVGGDLERFA